MRKPQMTLTNHRAVCKLGFCGNVSAKGFVCPQMQENRNWTFHTDYYGIAVCMHHLLMFQELTTSSILADSHAEMTKFADSIGYDLQILSELLQHQQLKRLYYPRAFHIRRYWDKALWTSLYVKLLNHDRLSFMMNIDKLLQQIDLSIVNNRTRTIREGTLVKLVDRLKLAMKISSA
jgi:hypothetical protein